MPCLLMASKSTTHSATTAARHNRNIAAQAVMCGQMCMCVLHTADKFGNALLHGGMDVQAHLSMQTPDGSHTAKVCPLATHLSTCSRVFLSTCRMLQALFVEQLLPCFLHVSM